VAGQTAKAEIRFKDDERQMKVSKEKSGFAVGTPNVLQARPDDRGVTITIPASAKSDRYSYQVVFECQKAPCPVAVFSIPVLNPQEELLEAVPQWHTAPVFGFTAHTIIMMKPKVAAYEVRNVKIVPMPQQGAAGLGLRFVEYGGEEKQGSWKDVPNIQSIQGGHVHYQFVEIGCHEMMLNMRSIGTFLESDWSSKVKEVPIRLSYTDSLGRVGSSQSVLRLEYYVPYWSRTLLYAVVLFFATILGVICRFALSQVAECFRLKAEAKSVWQSFLLAGVLWVCAAILGLKLEPIGTVRIDFTGVRGIIVIGLLVGLMPDVFRRYIQNVLPRSEAAKQAADDKAKQAAGEKGWRGSELAVQPADEVAGGSPTS
jgi:hypothetical protein